MKKLFAIILLALFCGQSFAQQDMTVVWESRMGHKIEYTGTGLESTGYSYAASDKEMTVFSNKDGKTIWTKDFKDLAPRLRKIDELIPFWDSKIVFLFERKMGKDQMACIDLEKGEYLWSTDKYQNVTDENVLYVPEKEAFLLSLKDRIVFVKARTGEEVWNTSKFKGAVGKYVYIPAEESMVMVNFYASGLAHLFAGEKNMIAKINITNGELLWQNAYIGRAERKVISRDFLFDLKVENDKVFLRINGLQVYDLKTGANLWSAAFDFTPDKLVKRPSGKVYKFGVYGAVADPIITENEIYVLDMTNKKNQYIKKYDLNTGKLLWTSKEIKGARVIPNMYLVDDKIILQIGGKVEIQYHREYKVGDITYWETAIKYPEVKPFGIQAFNTKDGSLAWQSERFKKGITNAIQINNNILVCSGKALYSMDIATGKENYEVPVKNEGVGQATMILPYNNDVIVVGEKGVSKFATADGKLICANKYTASHFEETVGNILIMKTDGSDIGTFKLDDCSYKEFKARKGAVTDLSECGKFVYVYENRTVTKLKTE